ncbi:MAG: DoxX family protein [Allosphingosinicella sp.]
MSDDPMQSGYERRRAVAMILLALFYIVAGCFHLAAPGAFVRVVPPWVRDPGVVIFVTGLCELAGVAALLIPRTRKLAAAALSLYAICVFPANIEHAVQDLSGAHHGLGWLYHAPRLFAQPLIVWWSLYAGGLVGGLRIPPERAHQGAIRAVRYPRPSDFTDSSADE